MVPAFWASMNVGLPAYVFWDVSKAGLMLTLRLVPVLVDRYAGENTTGSRGGGLPLAPIGDLHRAAGPLEVLGAGPAGATIGIRGAAGVGPTLRRQGSARFRPRQLLAPPRTTTIQRLARGVIPSATGRASTTLSPLSPGSSFGSAGVRQLLAPRSVANGLGSCWRLWN